VFFRSRFLSGNTFIVGDIHGCAFQLDELLCLIDDRIEEGDQVVFLGDYIDRGPNSKRVIELLLDFRVEYGADIIFLKGNHEQWLCQAFDDPCRYSWLLGMEGLSTVKSYSMQAADTLARFVAENGHDMLQAKASGQPYVLPYHEFFESMPGDHRDFFRKDLQDYYQRDDLICSHSGLEIGKALEEQSEKDLFWNSPKRMLKEWRGPEMLAVGHLPTLFVHNQYKGKAIERDRLLLLDTSPDMTGVLTCMRYPERLLLQVDAR
jgi:serine/threonine protein phosphatase 1